MYEDYIEFEDNEVEFFTVSSPYELWGYHRAELYRQCLRWTGKPHCVGLDMFPTRATQQAVLATTVCVGCPVQTDCLYLALVCKEEYGVWGGSTEGGRGEIISKFNQAFGNYAKFWKPEYEQEIRKVAEQFVATQNLNHGTTNT